MIKILQVRNIDSFVESRRQKTSEKDRKTVQSILNDVEKMEILLLKNTNENSMEERLHNCA